VNVSARQLRDRDFVATVKDVLDRTGMDPAALLLEITEGIFVEDGDRALSVLLELKALGVRLALDDFGTGYSSLGYLRRFPVDIVEIDRSFVADIGNDRVTEAIVSVVTELAHVLDLHVTAEGVETEQQAAEMIRIGCEFAQGFLYARPMTNTALRAHLAGSEGPALHLPQVRTVTG
jgi:EAL domain-containing protein (putative c-di-GMP-specific phosphodiesterase class I)